ncbi:hypothetical protein D9M68_579810 [compost metagenome]
MAQCHLNRLSGHWHPRRWGRTGLGSTRIVRSLQLGLEVGGHRLLMLHVLGLTGRDECCEGLLPAGVRIAVGVLLVEPDDVAVPGEVVGHAAIAGLRPGSAKRGAQGSALKFASGAG